MSTYQIGFSTSHGAYVREVQDNDSTVYMDTVASGFATEKEAVDFIEEREVFEPGYGYLWEYQ